MLRASYVVRMPILIDGNAFSHRWYHRWAHMVKLTKPGLPPPRAESFATNNARSLMALAQSIDESDLVGGETTISLQTYSSLLEWPNRVAVFFDFGDGGRTKVYPDYKKERRARPRDPLLEIFFDQPKSLYRGQPNNSCVVVPDLHHPRLEDLDAEADDMIATVSIALRKRGIPHAILSHDIDLMHLVHDDAPRVMQYDPRTKLMLDEAAVTERVGVPPSSIVDLKALGGDRGDGIPGMRGIGATRAKTLLKKYGDLDAVMSRGPSEEKGKKLKQYLAEGRDAALLSKSLVVHRSVDDIILPTVFSTFGILK
jgi:5'-3' exonuclease